MEHFWLSMFDSLLFVIHIKIWTILFNKDYKRIYNMFYFHFVDKSTEMILFYLMNIGSSQSVPIVISSKASR